jgi:hypothetical protein
MSKVGGQQPYMNADKMFKDNEELKEEFKNHFRNVSKIMDCVECEKCRLWGKIQVSGIGTALKILFSFDPLKHARSINQRFKNFATSSTGVKYVFFFQ